jgi:RimJ/RimL family protein N-acetyltransferase
MTLKNLKESCDQLRLEGDFYKAFLEVSNAFKLSAVPHRGEIIYVNDPIFWSDIKAGRWRLTKRRETDVGFLRDLWADHKFIYSFHRHAQSLPDSDQKLAALLRREYLSTIMDNRALHWIIRDADDKPHGLLSLVDISLVHRRAEVLIGVNQKTQSPASVAAMLMLFQFYFNVLKFKKLYSQIYADNSHSLKSTLHLGFVVEGVLKNHSIDPQSGEYLDLTQTALFAEQAFSEKNRRLMDRLLT